MYDATDAKLNEAAKVLFDSEPHPALDELYAARGMIVTWENAGPSIRDLYIKRVIRMKAQFLNIDFEEGAQALLNKGSR